jgi:hypothetical protein
VRDGRRSRTDGARQRATFELAFALLGLDKLDEAYTAFTAPQLVWAADIAAMAWSRQVRWHHGLAQVWLARGNVDHARHEAHCRHRPPACTIGNAAAPTLRRPGCGPPPS